MRGGQIRHQLKDPIEVETTYGFETVSLSRNTCSCSNQRNRTCVHRQQLLRWVNNFDRYLALSALHKEIRRGDLPRVKSWANIILQFQSPQSILKYLERIVFEETRDVSLWISLKQKSISVDKALEQITLTPKKWQLEHLNCPSHFKNWYDGFKLSEERSVPLPLEIEKLVNSCQAPVEAYSLYFNIRKDRSLRPFLLSQLISKADATKNLELLKILRIMPTSSYEIMIALEFLIGMVGNQFIKKEIKNDNQHLFIPLDKKYYFDIHTTKGKKLIKGHFWQAFKNHNFQFGELDLRHSGSVFGCLWREYSFRKSLVIRSDGQELSWSDAEIPTDLYEKAFELERHYYPHFLKN